MSNTITIKCSELTTFRNGYDRDHVNVEIKDPHIEELPDDMLLDLMSIELFVKYFKTVCIKECDPDELRQMANIIIERKVIDILELLRSDLFMRKIDFFLDSMANNGDPSERDAIKDKVKRHFNLIDTNNEILEKNETRDRSFKHLADDNPISQLDIFED